MNVLLKSAKVIYASRKDLHLKKKDIWIKNGKIEKIADKISPKGQVKVLAHKNLHVSVGWIDSGVSFGEPGYEERETIENGLSAAAKSGYTDVLLSPDINPIPDSSSDVVFLKNAAKNSLAALHPLGSLTVKSQGEDLAEMYDMAKAGAVGFYDYKAPIANPNLLKIALQYAQNFGGLVFSFPLDKNIAGKGQVHEGPISTKLGLKGIPALAEELQIARDLFILEYTGGKLHIPTISTANSVKLIAAAKKKGLDVSCSVAIHNLWYTDSTLESFDSKYKTMPPLREKSDTKALINGLKSGTIDFVTTDHSPINIEHKELEFDHAANGTIGLESAFGILNQLFDIKTVINLLTKGRNRFGLNKINFEEGEEARMTLFNPATSVTFNNENIASTSKNSMFVGEKLKGEVLGVICSGKVGLNHNHFN